MSSDFLWAPEEYVQRINPLAQYVEQSANALAVMHGGTVEEAKAFISDELKSGRAKEFHNPEMVYFERDENFVRTLKHGTLMGYLQDAVAKKEVIVPTLTTFVNPEIEESLISKFMKRNADARGVLKKEAQSAEGRGEMEKAYNLNQAQDNAKRNNNSMSGVMAALGSIFENPTGHNSLTSTTRVMSSLSNALNERMIGGNRHYMDGDTALNNMAAIISTMDLKSIKSAISKYNLVIPTADDVVKIVERSSKKYWRDPRQIKHVREFAEKMTDEQRAAVAYTQDLYHVRQLNDGFMRTFLEDFASVPCDVDVGDHLEYLRYVSKKEPLVFNYAPQVHALELSGNDKDYAKWPPDLIRKVALSCARIINATAKYRDFFRAFLVVRTLPCSTAYIDSMCRESVVLSDTDSTMFSVDNWVIWYFGELTFKQEAFGIAGAVMFVATQLIAHAMAIFSANMNVKRDKLFVLSMKPEFMFPVFAQTPVAKHYWCSLFIKEGFVYPKNKYEKKGVHLKSSAVPVSIIGPEQDHMEWILETIQAGNKLNLFKEVTRGADLERKIDASLMAGEPEYYKSLYIKTASSYALPADKSLYRFFDLWMDVWAPSYSRIEPPPYTVMKVPLKTTSRAKTAAWIAGMEDRKLAERMAQWLEKTGRKELPTFYIAMDYVEANGMPKELADVIDRKKIILDLTGTTRMVLETVGYRTKVDTLVSELGY